MPVNASQVQQRYYRKKYRHFLYSLVEEFSRQGLPAQAACKCLGISSSAYYDWRKQKDKEDPDKELKKLVSCIHEDHCQVLGYRKMAVEMEKVLGTGVNHKKAYRLMAEQGLKSQYRPKTRHDYEKHPEEVKNENLLNRDFNAQYSGQKICSDVTEFGQEFYEKGFYPGEKVYLCTNLDLYSSYPVSFKTSLTNDTLLTTTTLEMTVVQLNKDKECLFHRDRGADYTCYDYENILLNNNIVSSMSRPGKCLDNSVIEGFQGKFKDILKLRHPDLHSIKELEEAIKETMEYYRKRYPMVRYGIKSVEEVWLEGLNNPDPVQYPIAVNKRIQAFWEKVGKNR